MKTSTSSLLTMEGTETTREKSTAKDENQGADEVLLSSKPLHRFVRAEPRSLGIVIAVFGCAELLLGFHLAGEDQLLNSCKIYIPFWQGILFLVCGSLSIHAEIHPSKRIVTVSLAMYVVSLLGILVSAGFRIACLSHYEHLSWRSYYMGPWDNYRRNQLCAIESMLFSSSLCVLGLLISLCVIACLALKSTRTQVIVHHVAAPQGDTTSN